MADAKVLVAQMSIARKLTEYFDSTEFWFRLPKSWTSLAGKMKFLPRAPSARPQGEGDRKPARDERRGGEAASGSLARKSPASAAQRRILIYRLGSLGDTIVALPCLHKIAEAFPDLERYVLTNVPVSSKAAPFKSILGDAGLIHDVVVYPVGLRSITELWALARRLRALEISTLVYLMDLRGPFSVCRDLIFFRLCGVERIIGAPDFRTLFTSQTMADDGCIEQECVRLARSISALGPVDLNRRASWDLRLTDQERAGAGALVAGFDSQPFVAINMGGKAVENHHWGNENWSRLFAELAKTHGAYGLLVVGSVEDAACVGEVTKAWPSPVVNACGRLSPRESAAALEKACLFVGHDFGSAASRRRLRRRLRRAFQRPEPAAEMASLRSAA